jgi:hypothetical protein
MHKSLHAVLRISSAETVGRQIILNGRYTKRLQDHLASAFQGVVMNMEKPFFQQDGARQPVRHFTS